MNTKDLNIPAFYFFSPIRDDEGELIDAIWYAMDNSETIKHFSH